MAGELAKFAGIPGSFIQYDGHAPALCKPLSAQFEWLSSVIIRLIDLSLVPGKH